MKSLFESIGGRVGAISNLFRKRADDRSALERYIDGVSAGSMNRQVKDMKEPLKVPYAQAMSVLAFGGVFVDGLRKAAYGMPEPFRTDWPCPYDQILAECVAFYFYVLIKDHLPQPDEDGEWDDGNDDEKDVDPYFESLKYALHIDRELIYKLSGEKIHEEFVMDRALAYSSISRSKDRDILDELAGLIWKAWNPGDNGRPLLNISSPSIPIQTSIASMPIDAIVQSCRELYDVKMKDPNAY